MPKSDEKLGFAESNNPKRQFEHMQSLAEDGLTKAKEAFEQAQQAYVVAQKDVQANMDAVQTHTSKISLAALDNIRSNTQIALEHMEKLIDVKSASEFMEIQTRFIRQQSEIAVDTANKMQELYQSAANDLSRPSNKAEKKS